MTNNNNQQEFFKYLKFFNSKLIDSQINLTNVVSFTSNDEYIFLNDKFGNFFKFDKNFNLIYDWVDNEIGRSSNIHIVNDILVTLSEDENNSLISKCYSVDNKPTLIRKGFIRHQNQPYPVSDFTVSSDLNFAAIGFANGAVVVIKKFIDNDSQLNDPFKSTQIQFSNQEPITGLTFNSKKSLQLYISTFSQLFVTSIKLKSNQCIPLDDIGCDVNCLTLTHFNSADIIIARDEAIYLYNNSGRSTTYALEGRKSFIVSHSNYVIICSPMKNSDEGNIVTVFDLNLKFISFKSEFNQGVKFILTKKDSIDIICDDNKIYQLNELNLYQKLELLYKKDLYSMALNLVKYENLQSYIVKDVHKRYADYLYDKNDFENATNEYCQTIGFTQPSSIIRKFLDSQRINNLVTYLTELHSKGFANPDYTTLLLNCYTKLRDVESLDKFIDDQSQSTEEVQFDLEIAIRVLRQAGYINNAIKLSKRYHRHEDYLRIQIEDSNNYVEALSYLRKLKPNEVEGYLAHYGRLLLDNLTDDTTNLLIMLCSGKYTAEKDVDEEKHHELDTHDRKSSFNITSANPLSYIGYNNNNNNNNIINKSQQSSIDDIDSNIYEIPSPRKYFSHFIKHPKHLTKFIENVSYKRFGIKIDEIENEHEIREEEELLALINCLLEICLRERKGDEILREKGMRIIDKMILKNFDLNYALIICTLEEFDEGKIKIWEKMGLIDDIMNYFIEKEDENRLIDYLKNYGIISPNLYLKVLKYLTNDFDRYNKNIANIKRIIWDIEDIEKKKDLGKDKMVKLPKTTEIIQVLSREGGGNISVELIREWLMKKVEKDEEKMKVDEALLISYREESEKKTKKIQELKDENKAQSIQNTRCAGSGERLELPVIHFACGHSYNLSYLNENESECPKCAKSHGVMRELRRNQLDLGNRHDLFKLELNESNEGFTIVSNNFSKGII